MKKTFWRCMATVLLLCVLPTWAGEVREQTYAVGANVDARGHVIATQIDKDVPASIASILARSVEQWQFDPATSEGRPVPAHTFVSTKLKATPDASGHYGLRVSFEGNGPRMRDGNKAPKYPKRGLATQESEFVFLHATVQPDGHLSDMAVSSQFEDWPLHDWFKDSVLVAARHWRLDPESVDGKPVATQVRISINFVLDGVKFTPEQIRTLRAAAGRQDAQNGALAGLDIPLPSEQAVALDSRLKPSKVAALTSAP